MHLAFGGARADCSPTDQVRNVLRGDEIEELDPGRYAGVVQVEQQPPRDAQSLVDVEPAVEVGVVDQSFPPDRGARLFEIDAHDDEQPGGERLARPSRRDAYSRAAAGSWMEHGPAMTRSRSSSPARIRRIACRVVWMSSEVRSGRGSSWSSIAGVTTSSIDVIRRSSVSYRIGSNLCVGSRIPIVVQILKSRHSRGSGNPRQLNDVRRDTDGRSAIGFARKDVSTENFHKDIMDSRFRGNDGKRGGSCFRGACPRVAGNDGLKG